MDKPFKQITSLKSAEDLRTYLENNGNLNLSLMQDKNGATLLHYAAFKNDLVKLKIYFQHYKAYCEITHGTKMYEAGFQSKVKAWINKANAQGLTPIHFAALNGNIEIIKILQQLGANMQFVTKQKENLLFMAVQNNQLKTLVYLLQESQNKININDRNHIGDNILHKAARNGCVGIVAYLLTKPIDVNQQNQQGFTPLMQAVLCKNKQIVKNMLLKGVNRQLKNNIQQKAIDIARSEQAQQLVNILNDQFTFGQKIKIACNVKIVYRVEKSSYLYALFFILLYNIVFVPTCIITEFTNLSSDYFYIPIIGQGLYYLITFILFLILLRKPPKKNPLASLLNVQLPFCAQCRNQKRNQYHCFICETCIYRYDHHCPWINNCVGIRNIGKFYAFLWLIELGTIFVIMCHACMLGLAENLIKYRDFTSITQQQKAISIVCLLIALFFGISILMLIIKQTQNICSNTTQFERAKKQRAKMKSSKIGKPSQTLITSQQNQSVSFIANAEDQQQETSCFGNCSKMLCQSE